jgi:large subunit ribosomal protein L1
MPNPKSGTVTDDIPAGIDEVKAGRVEFKMDKTANVAVIVGKRSFTPEQIAENVEAAVKALIDARPEAVKSKYLKSLTLSSTMSPGILVGVTKYNNV